MKYDTLYKFCKNYTNEFEKCEENVLERMSEMIDEGYTKSEILEADFDTNYSSCHVYKAGLQAYIVDDFVKSLSPDLQSKIMVECMKQKTGGKFL